MVQDSPGLHHFHRRRRIFQKHEPYPHPKKGKRLLDKAIYFFGVVGPLMTIPQIWEIWYKKNASGVSVVSWGTYFIIAIFWLIYGLAHKEKPIILTYIFWIILDFLVVVGALVYG